MPKDNGKAKRQVADFRALNAKTIPDKTPMPHPEDIFGLLANQKVFAEFDITAIFDQIPIEDSYYDSNRHIRMSVNALRPYQCPGNCCKIDARSSTILEWSYLFRPLR